MLGWSNKLCGGFFWGWGEGKNIFLSPKLSSGLELSLPAKFQPPQRIASCVWILSRLGVVVVVVVVVKSNNSANSAWLSSASQLELSLAKTNVQVLSPRSNH